MGVLKKREAGDMGQNYAKMLNQVMEKGLKGESQGTGRGGT